MIVKMKVFSIHIVYLTVNKIKLTILTQKLELIN